jgi:shikimate 5-dehydrogenase
VTKPRTSTTRELYGIIGKIPNAGAVQSQWNAFFAKEGMDAFMDKYPTTVATLPERLSEMFHFDRRLYLVGKPLQEAIIPLLDALDQSAEEGGVDCVVNNGGVLTGYRVQDNECTPLEVLRVCGFKNAGA